MKTCAAASCSETSLSAFGKDKSRKDGLNKYCRVCHKRYQTIHRHVNKERTHKVVLESRARCLYHTTMEFIERLLADQNYKCAFPSCARRHTETDRLCTDHDHATGHIRGMLCREHNLLLGYAKDDPVVLTEAVEYLKGNTCKLET